MISRGNNNAVAAVTRCGLSRAIGGVNVSHYADIVSGNPQEKLCVGYAECLYPLIGSILQVIPVGERIEFIFEQQDRYFEATTKLFSDLVALPQDKYGVTLPVFVNPDGTHKIAKWGFLPKKSSRLFEPADALLYAQLQLLRDETSIKTKWCEPIFHSDATDPSLIWTGRIMAVQEIRALLLKRRGIIDFIGRSHLAKSGFENYEWAFCRNCKLPMFGMVRLPIQNGSYTCGSCYDTNHFDHSTQPTRSDHEPPGFRPSSGTQGT